MSDLNVQDSRYTFDNFVAGNKIIDQAVREMRDRVPGLMEMSYMRLRELAEARAPQRFQLGDQEWLIEAQHLRGNQHSLSQTLRRLTYNGIVIYESPPSHGGDRFRCPPASLVLQVRRDLNSLFALLLKEFPSLANEVEPFIVAATKG